MKSVQQLADEIGILNSSVRDRIKALKIQPDYTNNKGAWFFSNQNANKIINYKDNRFKPVENILPTENIIYVTRTYEIIPSRMNYEAV